MSTAPPRPPAMVRVANRILPRVLRKGKGPEFMRLLTVKGRRTGLPRTTPIVPVEDHGRVFLVSPYGDVEWVRNVRAVHRVELARGDEHVAYEAEEVGPTEAVPVLRTYLSMPSERFVRRDFAVTARSSDEAIEAEAPQHPVFKLTPVAPAA